MARCISSLLLFALCLQVSLTTVLAQEANLGSEDLSQAANDPTALLQAHQVQNFFTPFYRKDNGAVGNVLQYRGAVPFSFGGVNNIARVTVPVVTNSPSGRSGLGDIALFNLSVFDQTWGRFGVGAVAQLPTGQSGVGSGQWAIGPAFGFVVADGKLLWGAFSQNLFSVAETFDGNDLAVTNIQPIVNYGLGNGWSIGSSEMNILFDWKEGEFVALPLGVKLSKLTRFRDLPPIQFQLSYEHDFYDQGPLGAKDTLGFTVKVILP